jgi:type I restriction enzyme S subunit
MSEKIPKGWEKVKLGEVVTLHYGKSLPEKHRIPGNIPVYSSAGITGWHNESLVNSKGLIIGRKGTIGKVYRSYTPFFPIDTCYYIIPDDEKFDFNFLYYLLMTLNLEELNEDSAVPGLNRNTAYSQDILLPPLPEQKAIASVLSSLDDKIDLLHRQNQTLEKMAETLFRKCFIEDAKEDWEEGTIGQLISVQSGFAFKSKDFKNNGVDHVIKIKNIKGGIINLEDTDFIDSKVAEKIGKQFQISSGDVLIAMTGAEIGKLGIVPNTNKKLWLNQRVGLLKEKYPFARFLAYLQLRSDYGQEHINNTASGSAQPNISGEGIENCGFPKISEEQIISYSKQLGELYTKVIFNLGQIRTLEQMHDVLLPKLMRGEVRIMNNE